MEVQSLGDFSVVKKELEALEESSEEQSKEIKALQQQTAELREEETSSSEQIPALLTSIGLLESTISDYQAVVEAYNESLADSSALFLDKEKVSCVWSSIGVTS
jgi:predicted  nucleic acid-binding Zn-ribbon protein